MQTQESDQMSVPTPRGAVFAILFAVAGAAGLPTIAVAEPPKTQTVEAGDIKLTVPATWQRKSTTSRLRLAQFTVPKAAGDTEDAVFAVFYFGGTAGGVDANVQRWIKQFLPKDRQVKTTAGKCPQGDYILVDLTGTWMKPIEPLIQQRTIEMPHARVLGAILNVKDQGNYFLRLTGPLKTVSANADAFRATIGAAAKSEKEYKIADE